MARTLHQITEDADMTSAAKAEECLRAMGELEGGQLEDLALAGLRVAGQAYATLAVAEAIGEVFTTTGFGHVPGMPVNIADVVAVNGVRPR